MQVRSFDEVAALLIEHADVENSLLQVLCVVALLRNAFLSVLLSLRKADRYLRRTSLSVYSYRPFPDAYPPIALDYRAVRLEHSSYSLTSYLGSGGGPSGDGPVLRGDDIDERSAKGWGLGDGQRKLRDSERPFMTARRGFDSRLSTNLPDATHLSIRSSVDRSNAQMMRSVVGRHALIGGYRPLTATPRPMGAVSRSRSVLGTTSLSSLCSSFCGMTIRTRLRRGTTPRRLEGLIVEANAKNSRGARPGTPARSVACRCDG